MAPQESWQIATKTVIVEGSVTTIAMDFTVAEQDEGQQESENLLLITDTTIIFK